MRIDKLDRDSARTESERLLYCRPPPVRAAARLSFGLPIKALDPVGTCFLLFITANRQKVTENSSRADRFFQHGPNYTIVSPRLSTSNRPVGSFRHGALMPLTTLRLTGFCPASKLFFAASQKSFPVGTVFWFSWQLRAAPSFEVLRQIETRST